MSDIIVDLDTITTRYEVHKTTIGEWVKKYPEMKKDKNNYDLVECDYAYIQILKERLDNIGIASKLKEAQTKNFELKNKLLEIELKVKEEKLIDYELLAKKVNNILTIKRFQLQRLPLELATILEDKKVYKEAQDILDNFLDDFKIDCGELKVNGEYYTDYETEDTLINIVLIILNLIDKLYSDVLNFPEKIEDKEIIQIIKNLIKKIQDNEGILSS